MLGESRSLLGAIAQLLNYGLTIYMIIVVVRALISWVNPSPHNPFIQFLARVTDPVLYRIRRTIPVYFGGIDFSPVILILLLVFLQDFLVQSLVLISKGLPLITVLPLFIISVIRLVKELLYFLMIIVIVRAILSWVSPGRYNPIVRFVYGVTDPFLNRIRNLLPLNFGGIDLSPAALIAAIYVVNMILDSFMAAVGRAFV